MQRGAFWRLHAACAAAALALLAEGGQVTAAGSGAPGLRAVHANPQGYFEYRLAPGGEHVVDSAVVSNTGDAAADVLVYASDGYTSHVGGIVYGEHDEPLRPAGAEGAGNGAGRWITPSQGRLHLDAGASVTITFTAAVPAGTPPGDYVGGLVAENPTPASVNGGGLRVTQRSVVAVVIHVPGATQHGWSVGAPSVHVENGRRQVVEVPLASTGDVLAKPSLTGSMSTCSGSVMERFDRKLDTFLPHSQIDYPINIEDRVLSPGCYRLGLDFGDTGGGLTHADRQLTITAPQAQVPHFVAPTGASTPTLAAAPSTGLPPLVVGLIGGVGVLLLGNVLLLLRRRRRPPNAVRPGAEGDPPG